MAQLHFTLVAPERALFSGLVDLVVAPGEEGDFSVLAGHAPFMTTLRSGAVSIKEGGAVRRVFVQGGFADVTPEGLTILAEEALPVEEVDVSAVEAELQDAREDLADARDDAERQTAARHVARLEAMLAAVADTFYAAA